MRSARHCSLNTRDAGGLSPPAQMGRGLRPSDRRGMVAHEFWYRPRSGAAPVFRDGMVYVCTGYLKPELWAIRVDGMGDVTTTHVAWKYNRQVPEISSPILIDKEIYFVSNRGILTCLDALTGELCWQQRLEGNFAASPLSADGKLYITSQKG